MERQCSIVDKYEEWWIRVTRALVPERNQIVHHRKANQNHKADLDIDARSRYAK